MASSQDACYISLLGLAEYFRTAQPPNIKKCIQSLQALFTFKPPLKVEARTHLQMGQVLMAYTKNTELARSHLEQAWLLSENINAFDDVKFDTASLLAQLYQQQQQSALAKPILRKAIELSQHNCYWHCKLLFQLAQIHATDKEYTVASELLAVGVESTDDSNATYLRVLFLLSRGMILMCERKAADVIGILHQASGLIETAISNAHLKEYLKVFFLVLQVCYYLSQGHVKTVKPSLKQLQHSIQTIVAPSWPADEVIFGQNTLEMFIWLPREQLYVLVYLVTVSHSMMAGYMDKALKYTEKALAEIEKCKRKEDKPLLSVFQIILLEHIVQCRLVMGNKSMAIREIAQAQAVCGGATAEGGGLMRRHAGQLHCLLGLYAMSISLFEVAERQFQVCLQESAEKDLRLFAHLNLAIIYLRTKRDAELAAVLETVAADTAQGWCSQSLMGGFYYVQGLNSFHKSAFHEAKRFLRETLKMANAEDLNRLTSCSLVLLSHVFLSIGNSKESMNMVTPAMQLASKIPDIHVQLWGSAILKDLHRMSRNAPQEKDAYSNHLNFSQLLLADQYKCTKFPEHSLINWFAGEPPSFPPHPLEPGTVMTTAAATAAAQAAAAATTSATSASTPSASSSSAMSN